MGLETQASSPRALLNELSEQQLCWNGEGSCRGCQFHHAELYRRQLSCTKLTHTLQATSFLRKVGHLLIQATGSLADKPERSPRNTSRNQGMQDVLQTHQHGGNWGSSSSFESVSARDSALAVPEV